MDDMESLEILFDATPITKWNYMFKKFYFNTIHQMFKALGIHATTYSDTTVQANYVKLRKLMYDKFLILKGIELNMLNELFSITPLEGELTFTSETTKKEFTFLLGSLTIGEPAGDDRFTTAQYALHKYFSCDLIREFANSQDLLFKHMLDLILAFKIDTIDDGRKQKEANANTNYNTQIFLRGFKETFLTFYRAFFRNILVLAYNKNDYYIKNRYDEELLIYFDECMEFFQVNEEKGHFLLVKKEFLSNG